MTSVASRAMYLTDATESIVSASLTARLRIIFSEAAPTISAFSKLIRDDVGALATRDPRFDLTGVAETGHSIGRDGCLYVYPGKCPMTLGV